MTCLFAILLLLTCATLHAQSVVVKGTGAGAIRGNVTVTVATNVASVSTNLNVTGTLIPNVTGTYVQVANFDEHSSWDWDSDAQMGVRWGAGPGRYDLVRGGYEYAWTNSTLTVPVGVYYPLYYDNPTGTATIAYSYVTNYTYTTTSVVSVKGVATP